MGYSVRSSNFRYSQYVKFNTRLYQPQWPNNINVIEDEGKSEMYDLAADPRQKDNLISANGAESAAIDALEDVFFAHLETKFPKV